MRKFSTVLFILIFHNLLSAQNGMATKHFGLLAGTNTSNFNFNKGAVPPVPPISSSFQTSLRIGVSLVIPLWKQISLRNEYIFSQANGSRVDSNNLTYHFQYLSIPVLLSYQVSKRLFIIAGPEVSLLISAKKEGAAPKTITKDTEERSIGLTCGIGYSFYRKFSLHLRYMQGLNHIGVGQRPLGWQEFKLEQVQAMVGYSF